MYSIILFAGLELASRQNAKQDTSCLPSLNISGKHTRGKWQADFMHCFFPGCTMHRTSVMNVSDAIS